MHALTRRCALARPPFGLGLDDLCKMGDRNRKGRALIHGGETRTVYETTRINGIQG